MREAQRRFNVRPITEASVHGPTHAQDFEKTVVALARLGVFSVDLVERALLDEGEDIVLLLAKAAGCSWTTARELLLNSSATARNIVAFYERRMVLRANADEKNEDAPRQDTVDNDTIDDDVIFVPSPSTAPL